MSDIVELIKLGGFKKGDTREEAMDKMMKLVVMKEHIRLFTDTEENPNENSESISEHP